MPLLPMGTDLVFHGVCKVLSVGNLGEGCNGRLMPQQGGKGRDILG